jgi:hypothetical protein
LLAPNIYGLPGEGLLGVESSGPKIMVRLTQVGRSSV